MRTNLAWVAAAGLALAAGGALATTMSPDPVLFQGVFTKPPVEAAALRAPQGAKFSAQMHVVNNGGAPLRLSKTAALSLQLVDAKGAVVPFAGGANMGRAVRPADAVAVAPGQSLTLPLSGSLRLAGGQLTWRGDDGLMGFWPLAQAPEAYSLRLRYHGLDRTAWSGEGLSHAVPLPKS